MRSSSCGFVNWDLAAGEHRYLGFIDIDAGNAMPAMGKACSRNQSYITCAEYRNPHFEILFTVDWQGSAAHAFADVAPDLGRAP
jgi:hypothetical protein